MRIGDEVFIHGFVDEIRGDIITIKNKGGYFSTVNEEVYPAKGKVEFDEQDFIRQIFEGNEANVNF